MHVDFEVIVDFKLFHDLFSVLVYVQPWVACAFVGWVLPRAVLQHLLQARHRICVEQVGQHFGVTLLDDHLHHITGLNVVVCAPGVCWRVI